MSGEIKINTFKQSQREASVPVKYYNICLFWLFQPVSERHQGRNLWEFLAHYYTAVFSGNTYFPQSSFVYLVSRYSRFYFYHFRSFSSQDYIIFFSHGSIIHRPYFSLDKISLGNPPDEYITRHPSGTSSIAQTKFIISFPNTFPFP